MGAVTESASIILIGAGFWGMLLTYVVPSLRARAWQEKMLVFMVLGLCMAAITVSKANSPDNIIGAILGLVVLAALLLPPYLKYRRSNR